MTWQKEAVKLFGSWKASRCVFLIMKKKVRSMRSTDNDDVVGLGSRKAKVLFLIMKKKVRSIRSTDNDNAGLLGSLKTSRWFG